MNAEEAIVAVLHKDRELEAAELYDRAQRLYDGTRNALLAARWRLTDSGEVMYIATRNTYRLRSEVRREIAAAAKREQRGMSGREAILRVLADNDGEMEPEELYDAAQKLHGGNRQAVRAARYQLENDDPPRIAWVVMRQVYKLTRAGWDEVEELDE